LSQTVGAARTYQKPQGLVACLTRYGFERFLLEPLDVLARFKEIVAWHASDISRRFGDRRAGLFEQD
jgi:hypothetical protein